MSINNKDKTVSSVINPDDNEPGITSISINGTKVLLLDKLESDDGSEINLAALEKENTNLAAGSGFVGSKGSTKYGSESGGFSKMRFGVYNDGESSHLFVTGTPATKTQMSWVADSIYGFAGSAIIGKDGQYEALPDSIKGQVDFYKKNVDLDLAIKESQYKIKAGIDGSTFASTAEHENETGVATKGAFYGYVDSLAGFMQIKKGDYAGYTGVYGAKETGAIKRYKNGE